IIVLLDEPELYFHPEWQSKLIHLLIMYFKTIFRDYNIQIILTSNTPYLLSDLPRENVLLFNKELDIKGNEFTTTIDYVSIPKTFGQNIHTLLKQAFFMETTLGKFAEEKINEIISVLNFEDEQKPSKRIALEKKFINQHNDIKKTINMIGEPLIRNYLEDLFQLKIIQSEKLTTEQKVNEIDLEIQRLIRQKNKLEISDANLGDKKND
ncbi:AAA family ATPase, partial [Priestia megaterium]|uniref:AAA family ATPase n=1 Tax=Priestia megaterium TaxID=1404 RepID=UPI002FFDCD03